MRRRRQRWALAQRAPAMASTKEIDRLRGKSYHIKLECMAGSRTSSPSPKCCDSHSARDTRPLLLRMTRSWEGKRRGAGSGLEACGASWHAWPWFFHGVVLHRYLPPPAVLVRPVPFAAAPWLDLLGRNGRRDTRSMLGRCTPLAVIPMHAATYACSDARKTRVRITRTCTPKRT